MMMDANGLQSLQLVNLPEKSANRIIDNGMLFYEASVAGFNERYRRGETSHTIHVWWARRPHSAMRTLAFASLCRNSSKDKIALMLDLCKSANPPHHVVEEARRTLKRKYKHTPKVLDMFGGGGTIALECARIGAKAYSIDTNELSHFIQYSNLISAQKIIKDNLLDLLMISGKKTLSMLSDLSEILYPLRNRKVVKPPYVYLWTYSNLCSKCDYKYYVSKRPWISKKKGNKIFFNFINDFDSNIQKIDIAFDSHENKIGLSWYKNKELICPKCGHKVEKISVKRFADEVIGIVSPKERHGKEFCKIDESLQIAPPKQDLIKLERKILKQIDRKLPNSTFPKWSGIVNPALYGIEKHIEMFNLRQRVVLLMLIKCLRDIFEELSESHSKEIAKHVTFILSALIDQLVDWNCRISMWIPQNEQVGRALCGPGIPMFWDYAEIDPLGKGPANLWDKLRRIVSGVQSIGKFEHYQEVEKAAAQDLPFKDSFFDAIITDPPYYDNIFYSILADCIYIWKRLLFEDIAPEIFHQKTTSFKDELVASAKRNDTPENAHETYCAHLGRSIKEAERVLKSNGVFSFIYSHSSMNGWDAIIRAFRPSNLLITSVQPLSIERKQRPRAMNSKAVNTCLTLIAHKAHKPKETMYIGYIVEKVKSFFGYFDDRLKAAGLDEADIALWVYANGVAMLSNAKDIKDGSAILDNYKCLEIVGRTVAKKFDTFKITKRKSL